MSRAVAPLGWILLQPRSVILMLGFLALVSCASPEDGRPRGGGAGGDGGNYPSKPIAVPSKLDGTRSLSTGVAP